MTKYKVQYTDIPCKICGKPITTVAAAHGDPFCSTECARVHYGVCIPHAVKLDACHLCNKGVKDAE